MKKSKIFYLLFFLFFFNLGVCQKRTYINKEGDTISKSQIKDKEKQLGYSLTRWSYTGEDGKNYVKLSENVFLTTSIDYDEIRTEIEKVTNSKLSDSTTVIIEYYYKDDMCTDSSKDNEWSKEEISKRKTFLRPIKKKLNYEGVFFICLFENGIILKNNTKKDKEYFFTDAENFFRQKVFLNPTTCGSYAAIKPNGETLIRNGEYRADSFANYLKPENWALVFDSKMD